PYCDKYDPSSLHATHARTSPLDPFLPGNGLPDPGRLSPGPDHEKILNELTAQTYGMITQIDDEVGRIVRYLKDTGRYDSTAILFVSDHGEYLGSHGLL